MLLKAQKVSFITCYPIQFACIPVAYVTRNNVIA